MTMNKLKRYHIDIYWPDWFEKSIVEFTEKIGEKQLVCSYHATRKYERLSREYKKAIRDLLATINLKLCDIYIFEFYANDKEIKKVCYRFPSDLQSDIIFVVSSTGKLVTIFTNRNFDPHLSLQKDLYEQE